ncbi:Density-regulated protein [Zea mays]|uniref:Density-regulated protein n=1 Tax=Zea mays TaxID=4577 RepID=A0A1D6FGC1_MAIZE|nr:Density-regulated protein [Zea mays]
MSAEKPAPVRVLYCGVCGLPAEYCEFGPDFERCKPWLRAHAPGVYPDDLVAASSSPGSSRCHPARLPPSLTRNACAWLICPGAQAAATRTSTRSGIASRASGSPTAPPAPQGMLPRLSPKRRNACLVVSSRKRLVLCHLLL